VKGYGVDGHHSRLVASPGRGARLRKARLAESRRWAVRSGPVTVLQATQEELEAARRRRDGEATQ